MGEKTALTLVREGGLLAGRDDLEARLLVRLPMWLDSVAMSWPWPVLKKTATGLSLPAGTTALTLGRTGVIADRIGRIVDNVWAYTADYRTRQRVRVTRVPAEPVNAIYNPTSNLGIPTSARIAKTSAGVWSFQPTPIPDQNYLLVLDYLYIPPFVSSSPVWYENDMTVLAAVQAMALEHADGVEAKSTLAAQQAVAMMLAQDKVRFGQAPGENDQMQLDDSVFL